MLIMVNETISTTGACELLGITRQTLYKLYEKGDIPGKKIGGKYRFIESELVNYMKKSDTYSDNSDYREWELTGNFATSGIKKMAKRTFQELASNLEELIINSYDADATLVEVFIDHDKSIISITDDGHGMDEKTLSTYVIYGSSQKSSSYKSPKFERVPIGEYGIGGKLAITNICRVCKIITRKDGKEHVFNMDRATLDKAKYVSDIKSKVFTKKCSPQLHGTRLLMEKLFAKTIDSERLYERFSTKMPSSQNFKIKMIEIKDGERKEVKVEEASFDYEKKFEFEKVLPTLGSVKMRIFFTKEPIPSQKQGIWTKVNGRTVNEKPEWFDLFRATSGTRYRYRLYGFGEADGLKDFVTFSKNDFIDCPEYREYWDFGHKNIMKVQNVLLKEAEHIKREQEREVVKNVEKEVNDLVSKLDNPLEIGKLELKIKKEYTQDKQEAPDITLPDLDLVEKEATKIAQAVRRGKDKRERRNQNIKKSERHTYSGKNYTINTIDLSKNGDLVKFTKEKNLIEVNERHSFYMRASKDGSLNRLVKVLAFTEIANDYSDGNFIIFNNVFNELAKLASEMNIN